MQERTFILTIVPAITLIIIAVIIGISTDISDEEQFTKAGLEQCLIQDVQQSSGARTSYTIWVKDCTLTLKAIKDNK